jgi:hypothetical protein
MREEESTKLRQKEARESRGGKVSYRAIIQEAFEHSPK